MRKHILALALTTTLAAQPTTISGAAVHYDPNVLGNVMRYERSANAAPEDRLYRDPLDYVCWIGTSYAKLGDVVRITTSFWRHGVNVQRRATCLVVDTTRKQDLAHVRRLDIVAEFAHSQATYFCGALNEPARACRVTLTLRSS